MRGGQEATVYQSQVKFSGSIGYITNKKAPLSIIHPSKKIASEETF